MPLTITLERFAAIRAKIMLRKAVMLAVEIITTDLNDQSHFHAVDDFLKFADTVVEDYRTGSIGEAVPLLS
jgi:hypothetical protein